MTHLWHTRVAAAFVLVVAPLAAGAPGDARADEAGDSATAQTLFDEAKALMQSKRYADACPKLEQSQKLQPAGGTLLFLSLCLEGQGRTASAWVRFNQALSTARRDRRTDREAVANEHLAALVPQLTKLTVDVPEGVRTTGLEVMRDGKVVPTAAWGDAVPVDPGLHTVRATAPGHLPWETKVTSAEPGATAKVEVPALELDPAASAVALSPPPQPHDVAPPPQASTWGPQKTAAVVVGGVGVVGLALGAGFGVAALVEKGNESGATRATTSDAAYHEGNTSSIALGIGAAAAIAGGVLWLTTPKVKPATAGWHPWPVVGPHGAAGVGLTRAW